MSNFVCFVKVMREVNVLRIPPSYLPYIFVELKLKNKKLQLYRKHHVSTTNKHSEHMHTGQTIENDIF